LKRAFGSLAIWSLVAVNLILIASLVTRIVSRPEKNKAEVLMTGGQGAPEPIIKVEVLNGCGVPGVAKQFTNYLRSQGFDVVKSENYSSFDIQETLVVDRVSMGKEKAQKVAEALGVSPGSVLPQLNPDLLLDVSVILGKDYRSLKAYQK